MNPLYTIGHSTHPINYLIELLQNKHIVRIFDVRSNPFSRYNPQFNQKNLSQALIEREIDYQYMGQKLGGRSKNPNYVIKGKVQYNLISRSEDFHEGLESIRSKLGEESLAIMCSEKDPLQCHRAILICRCLRNDPYEIFHILANGEVETQKEMEMRLLVEHQMAQPGLFVTVEEQIQMAYDEQAKRIAFDYYRQDVKRRGNE